MSKALRICFRSQRQGLCEKLERFTSFATVVVRASDFVEEIGLGRTHTRRPGNGKTPLGSFKRLLIIAMNIECVSENIERPCFIPVIFCCLPKRLCLLELIDSLASRRWRVFKEKLH